MKGTSKVIMGATLVMVVSLAIVLGLILVLLAELYCSLLLRRRRNHRANSATADPEEATTTATAAAATRAHQEHSSPSPGSDHNSLSTATNTTPLSSFYAQGVLQAPRSLLFPAISLKEDCLTTKKQLSNILHNHNIEILQPPRQPETEQVNDDVVDHLVYISNPVYENAETRELVEPNTPFETPDTSPSRLENMASSGDDDDEADVALAMPSSSSSPLTPPLTPMKKLPAEACSVSLRDATSLATSGSDSNAQSSSSSGSPCTSPSW